MKRSPDSSCSSPSSSAGSSTITVPDQQIPEKPIKIKRSRKTQKLQSQSQCRNKSPAATTTSATARRSSIYRGVTRHRWTGRFEAHLWDKSSWNNIQNKKGRQVYLGAYDSEEAAAHTYDLAALKYWGPETTLNFPIETYGTELEEMKRASKEEYLASLRRRSSGFSRGVSKYRGVARHHHNGRWEARIGRVFGNKYLYLGTYNTQEEAAAAYDMAAIEHRGPNAVTNFDISNYIDRMKDKGLLLPHIAQEQSSSEQSGEEEAEVDQKPHHSHQEAEPGNEETEHQEEEKQKEGEMLRELDQYPQMMSPCNMDEHELSWSFCMDAGGFSPLPLPNNLLQGELPDPFEDSGFEDNIDFIFDSTYRSDALLLSSSSPSSTTTLVSCNYSG